MPRFALFFLAADVLFGQSGGMITGTITDQDGAVVPGVKLRAINLDTDAVFEVGASQTGNFVVSVPPGEYNILVEQPGFKKVTKSALQVEGNTSLRVDIVLMSAASPRPRLIHPILVPPLIKRE
jgi:uncharacterized membrane protein